MLDAQADFTGFAQGWQDGTLPAAVGNGCEAHVPRKIQKFHVVSPGAGKSRKDPGSRDGPALLVTDESADRRASIEDHRICRWYPLELELAAFAPENTDGDKAIFPCMNSELVRLLGFGRDRNGAAAVVIGRASVNRLVRAARE